MLFCCLYFLLYAGFATELAGNLYSVLLLMCSFLLSRCISGFAVVTFRSAKSNGLLHTFTDAAQTYTVACTMIGYFIVAATLLFIIDWFVACFALAGALLSFLYVRIMCYRQFGGITGDIAGYLVQLCELTTLIGITAGLLIERAVF